MTAKNRQLTSNEMHTIVEALRLAADEYTKFAGLDTGRISEQFHKQARDATRLREMIEEFDEIELWRYEDQKAG